MNGPAGLAPWIDQWIARQSVTPEVVLTRGHGPHLRQLALAYPEALILSWSEEQNARRRDGNIVTASREGDRIGAVARGLLTLGLEVLKANPPQEILPGPPTRDDLENWIPAWRRQARVEMETLYAAGEGWADHLDENLPLLLSSPGAIDLSGALRGKPVLVVGSGPSRKGLLPELKGYEDRVVILAANSAVRALYEQGVRPDGVVVIEGKDCARDLEGVPAGFLADAVLFAKASTHPEHLAWPFPRRAIFLGPADSWLEGWFGPGSSLPTGGNVGTASLVIAWMLGGWPVMATGLDFALAPGGVEGRRGGDGSPTETVRSWSGEPLQAELPFVCYREQTEQILATIGAQDPRSRFLSVSAQGARIAGMELTPWKDLREILGPLGPFSMAQLLEQTPRRHPRDPERLERSGEAVLTRFDTIANDALGPAIGLALADPPDRLLRALATPALIRARTEERTVPRAAEPAAWTGVRARFQRSFTLATASAASL